MDPSMASSSLTKSYSPLFITSSGFPTITKEELYSFHSIDRALFTRLVFELECNKEQSLRVMTFWIWLERSSLAAVVYTILEFPDQKLRTVYDEAVLCLKFVGDELSMDDAKDIELPLIQSIARKMDICPKFFIVNRVNILSGLEKAFQDVCSKAFDDIIEKVSKKKIFKASGVENCLDLFTDNGLNLSTMVSDVMKIDEVNMPMPIGNIYTESTIVHNTCHHGPISLMQPPLMQPPPQDEVANMLRLLHLSNKKEEEEASPDERTIFLTFSKGYPIPEDEVREFFTRLLGDLVEKVHMQDVAEDEQPLYARLVLCDPCAIYKILGGQNKAKFSINGKHLWARRYIHKINKSSMIIPTIP